MILTGGKGTRLAPLTPGIPKSLVPVLNRPLIAYSLDFLAGAGMREIVVVVGGDDDRTGPAALELAPEGVEVTIAVQPEPRGSGDAAISPGAALDGRRAVVLVVDAILQGDLRSAVDAFTRSDAVAWLVLHHTDRPKEMGIALLEGDRVVDLEEKPQQPKSDLALVGVWMLSPEAIERLRTNPVINAKGENDLSATLAQLHGEGAHIGGTRFEGRWLDAGAIGAILAAQTQLLAEAAPPAPDLGGVVDGARVEPPVLVASDATVEGGSLGPNVVVGAGARLRGVTLRNALVAPGATLEGGEYDGVVVTPSGEIGRP